MKYLIYALVGLLILWSAAYLIYDFHRRLKGKRGCGSGGCASCPHEFCRHRDTKGDRDHGR